MREFAEVAVFQPQLLACFAPGREILRILLAAALLLRCPFGKGLRLHALLRVRTHGRFLWISIPDSSRGVQVAVVHLKTFLSEMTSYCNSLAACRHVGQPTFAAICAGIADGDTERVPPPCVGAPARRDGVRAAKTV